jgi:hypothetical protein
LDVLWTLALVSAVLLAGTLIQQGDTGLGDMPAFGYVLILGLCAGLALLLFGVVLPRARARDARHASLVALAIALLSAVLLFGLWPGLGLVLGPAAMRLGLDARRAGARTPATLAITLAAMSLLTAIIVIVLDWFPF